MFGNRASSEISKETGWNPMTVNLVFLKARLALASWELGRLFEAIGRDTCRLMSAERKGCSKEVQRWSKSQDRGYAEIKILEEQIIFLIWQRVPIEWSLADLEKIDAGLVNKKVVELLEHAGAIASKIEQVLDTQSMCALEEIYLNRVDRTDFNIPNASKARWLSLCKCHPASEAELYLPNFGEKVQISVVGARKLLSELKNAVQVIYCVAGRVDKTSAARDIVEVALLDLCRMQESMSSCIDNFEQRMSVISAAQILLRTEALAKAVNDLYSQVDSESSAKHQKLHESIMNSPKYDLEKLTGLNDALAPVKRFESQFQKLTESGTDNRESRDFNRDYAKLIKFLDELTQFEEAFRKRFAYRLKGRVNQIAFVIRVEDGSKRLLDICLQVLMVVSEPLHEYSNSILDEIKSQDNVEKCKQKLEDLMVSVLICVNSILAHSEWLRQSLAFWRSFESNLDISDAFDKDSNSTPVFVADRIKRDEQRLNEVIAVGDKFKSLRRRLAFAMSDAGVLEKLYSYERTLQKTNDALINELSKNLESTDASEYFARMNEHLIRITKLLEQFDRLFLQEDSSSIISTMSKESSTLLKANRAEARNALAELIESERCLRFIGEKVIDYEEEQLYLWTRRVQIAKQMDNPIWEIHTLERKRIHEEFLEKLKSFLAAKSTESSGLPAAFLQARIVVERIEQKCGLVPNEVLRENSFAFAFSLFDRILLLLEGLDEFLEEESWSSVAEQGV